ncbi:MAG: YbhN family protein [Dehalococcoidia bacterium]
MAHSQEGGYTPIRRPPTSLRRRFLSIPTLISFALAAAFLLFLTTRFQVDLGAIWQDIRQSHLGLYLLAFLVHYTTFLFRGARWRILLKNAQGPQSTVPSVWGCAGLILLGWFANSITWFRLGDAYRAYTYSEESHTSFPRTAGTILAERVIDVVLVFLLLLVAAVTLYLLSPLRPSGLFLVIAAALLVVVGLILVAMFLFRSYLAPRLPRQVASAYERFHQGTVGSFQHTPLVLLLGLLGWMAEVGRLYLVLLALGFPLSFPLVVFVTLANAILTLVLITPGGLGIVEPGITGLLLLELSKSEAISAALLDRSISYLSIVILGALFFVAREVARSRAARHRELPLGRS